MKIQMIIVKLLVLGALFIISNQNLHLGILQEREIFFNAYSGWIESIVGKIIDVTGNAVRLEWLPNS